MTSAATMPPSPRATPTRKGPTRAAALSVQPVMTLAAVSSSAVQTAAGSTADWAGRVTVSDSVMSGVSDTTTG